MAAETVKCSTGIAEWTSSEYEPSTVRHQAICILRRRIASPLIIIKIALYWHCYCSGFISFNPSNCPCSRNFCDPHFTEGETEIQRLITGTSVPWLMKSDPQFKVRPADCRALVLSNQKSQFRMRERKAGGWAGALSSLGIKALVLCLEATADFELKMWRNLLHVQVSFTFPCTRSWWG